MRTCDFCGEAIAEQEPLRAVDVFDLHNECLPLWREEIRGKAKGQRPTIEEAE